VKLHESHSLVNYLFKKKIVRKLVHTFVSILKTKPLITIYNKFRTRVISNRISKRSFLISDFSGDDLIHIKYFDEVTSLELREINDGIINFYSTKSKMDHINTDSI